ncbi:MAG: hypothetical protein CMJ59_15805 [Planctomycetaceae bacterium]|nr:hypothetical protein [Planctomycetaceae bacterium]
MPINATRSSLKTAIVPVLLVAIGAGSLLSQYDLLPEINEVWSLGLVLVGGLSFLVGGYNKATVVIGPFFLIAALLSVLRQLDYISIEREIPIILISAGMLMLFARSAAIPNPPWLERSSDPTESTGSADD